MPARKRQIEIEVLVDDARARANLNNLDQNVSKTGKTLSNFAKIAAGAFAFDRVVDFGRQAIDSFSELEQAIGGTEAVFGDASDTVDEFAKTSADALGLAESEFRTATTAIGGQLKRMTGDVDFAAEQSVILTQVAADLAATYGGTTVDAVKALGSAFRGEADPAERFNLNLKISQVNAKAVELGLAETTAAVDENARAQATLALIMEQSSDAQGQFAREADTVAGKLQRSRAEAENLRAEIGEQLAPAFQTLLQTGKSLAPVLAEGVAGGIAAAAEEAEPLIRLMELLSGVLGENTEELGLLERAIGAAQNTINPFGHLYRQIFEEDLPAATEQYVDALTAAEVRAREAFAAMSEASSGARDDIVEDLAVIRASLIFAAGTTGRTTGDDPFAGRLPNRHQGGIVPGTPGSNVPIMAQAGEMVTRRANVNGSGGGDVHITVNGFVGNEARLAEEIDKVLYRRNRRTGLSFLS